MQMLDEPLLWLLLEGQQCGDYQYESMGVYRLMERKVNGRWVWKKMREEAFIYYASNNKWMINNREAMEEGIAAGWMGIASTATTPDKTTLESQTSPCKVWRVWDTSGGAWHDAPNVRAVPSNEKPAYHAAAVPLFLDVPTPSAPVCLAIAR
jgi:hypothetical protein